MWPHRSAALLVAACWAAFPASAVAGQQGWQPSAATDTATSTGLRTFTLAKPRELLDAQREPREINREPLIGPRASDRLRTTVGLGYVQGADWGTEVLTTGDVHGLQVQSSALISKGYDGFVLDNGAVSIFDPDRQWQVEAGDVFSYLAGASRGARVSWGTRGRRRPSVAFYVPRWPQAGRKGVLAYRDQLALGEHTLFEAELASDRSYLARSRFTVPRLEIEAGYRSNRRPEPSSDASVFGGITVWRGVSLTASVLRSDEPHAHADWRTVGFRIPVSPFLTLGFERAFAGTDDSSTTTTALMVNGSIGGLRYFHRFQVGDFERELFGTTHSVQRQQVQSMASYTPASRVQLSLQLASQRMESGVIEHWEELQATMALSRRTSLRLVTSVPDLGNQQRFRAYLRQELPRSFALQADYGRVSAFQDVPFELDRPRLKVMLYKTWTVVTPARGGIVSGRVLDHTGRRVQGVRVKLGPYTAETDVTGTYVFSPVPRGAYLLTLDPQHVPADYAWDERRVQLSVTPFSRLDVDLLVAPLNAIHGRVFVDRNANGRFDVGEGLAAAVVQLEDASTATDAQGAFSFYNVLPGSHVVRLNTAKLPPGVQAVGSAEHAMELGDSRPATGLDFRLSMKEKPIIMREPRR